jgi:hypothetical protein
MMTKQMKKGFLQKMYSDWKTNAGTNTPVWNASEEMGMAFQDSTGTADCEEILSEAAQATKTYQARQHTGSTNVNLEQIERRLARLESRVVQLMLHFGVDPYRSPQDQNKQTNQPKVFYRGRQDQR